METSFDSTRPPNIPLGIDTMDYIIIIIIPAKMHYPAELSVPACLSEHNSSLPAACWLDGGCCALYIQPQLRAGKRQGAKQTCRGTVHMSHIM